jgi:hypothetical protein
MHLPNRIFLVRGSVAMREGAQLLSHIKVREMPDFPAWNRLVSQD